MGVLCSLIMATIRELYGLTHMKTGILLFLILVRVSDLLGQQATSVIPVFDRFEDMAPHLEPHGDTTHIINFWATWCKPCVKELPYFQQLHEQTRDMPVKIILVSLDMKKDVAGRLPDFLKSRHIEAEVLALTDTKSHLWIPKVDAGWSGAIPATWIRQGNQSRFVETEFEDLASLLDWIQPIVNIKP